MTELLATTLAQAQQNSIPELIAVILGVAYLLLAMRENILCWYAALVSTAIFLVIFWDVRLYMESGLQVFYLIMAVYGWYQWRGGLSKNDNLAITSWSSRTHINIVVGVLVLSAVTGTLLERFTDAELPFLDSVTTWGAIVTTYMVAKKVLENWIYWFVIDGISIYLYLDRGLYFTALLFAAYVIIVIFGYLSWQRSYQAQMSH
jgi:nicotinamide mononucleotide transporter